MDDDHRQRPNRLGTMDHLRLSVSDIAAARRFYGPLMEFLGYRLEEDAVSGSASRPVRPVGDM